MWRGKNHIQHIAIEGLATASGIQGPTADACVSFLKHHNIGSTMKWLDDFIFSRCPLSCVWLDFSHMTFQIFSMSVHPWESLSTPSHGKVKTLTMNSHMLASNGTLNSAELIPNDKCNCVIHKLDFILNPANTTFSHHNIASIPGSLQHLTFIYREGGHALTSISSFLSHFPNDFAKITYLR